MAPIWIAEKRKEKRYLRLRGETQYIKTKNNGMQFCCYLPSLLPLPA